MEINFSRHARRRAKLYKIPEDLIVNLLSGITAEDGQHEMIQPIEGLAYPLKIVFVIESHTITVVTAYPLKKGLR